MPSASTPKRPLRHSLLLLALWAAFYASFTLFMPPLLDDADSVHAEVAREMLLRHDWITLYANGIRYLEKAPLLYWSMAATMRVSQSLGHASSAALAVAARIPLALAVLALAFAVEAFARRAFHAPQQPEASARAGLYAALILLSSFGIFLFTRILIPDAMLCLWLALAMLAFWMTEAPSIRVPHVRRSFIASTMGLHSRMSHSSPVPRSSQPNRDEWVPRNLRLLCCAIAACCALGVLAKGLIGIVFPIAIAALYLLLTRGPRAAIARIRQLHPFISATVFLGLAAPWHILIALANPTQGHPGGLSFNHGHWHVPLPTDGNVHGWAWFYFVNEQLLRYLNLRVPRDYDTVPLWLFWGLCLIWLMPWSAFLFHAIVHAVRSSFSALGSTGAERDAESKAASEDAEELASEIGRDFSPGTKAPHSTWALAPETCFPTASREVPVHLLLLLWAAIPLLFFSFSTRQEYYVLPSLPPLAILIAGWLATDSTDKPAPRIRRAILHCTAVLVALGAIFAAVSLYFLLHAHTPAPNTDLAALLRQNPADYALSMGHFLDLNANALGLFRLPLALAAASLFLGPLASYLLRRRASFETSPKLPNAATLALAAGAFGFLLAAHLGLQTFAPVLTSQQLAAAIAPQLLPRPGEPPPLIVVHQEYEYASTLGFYLQRPSYTRSGAPHLASEMWDESPQNQRPVATNPIRILTDPEYNGVANYGRSSNLWYGSFFPDAPHIFETPQTLAKQWLGPQRIFLWQDLSNQPSPLPPLPGPTYVLAQSGGKEIVSNQPDP